MGSTDNHGGSGRRGFSRDQPHPNYQGNQPNKNQSNQQSQNQGGQQNSNQGNQQNPKQGNPQSRNRRRPRGRRWADNRGGNNTGQGFPPRFRGSNREENHFDRRRGQGHDNVNSFQKFRDNSSRFNSMGAVNEKPTVENSENYSYFEPVKQIPENITLNAQIPVPEEKSKPSSSSSTSTSSSDSEASEDSAVRSLKLEVNKTLLANKEANKDTSKDEAPKQGKAKKRKAKLSAALEKGNVKTEVNTPINVNNPLKKETKATEKKNEKPADAKQPPIKSEGFQEKPSKELLLNVKKEQTTKSDTSSTSSSSSSSSEDSSLEESDENAGKPSSVEDVICLGNLEKFENLVEEEIPPGKSVCVLCDKSGHISFHCQMICKNCNGKYHGLKDCPKPANLAIVFSNFLQFCLKQSWKYNPNAEFTVDEVTTNANLKLDALKNEQMKRKSRSGTPRSTRKRQKSSSSDSSDSNSESTPTRKKKRRSKRSDGIQTPLPMPFTVPFPPAFNSFGMAPSGAVNPLLAFSHMMGYNPTSMDFRGNMTGKEQH